MKTLIIRIFEPAPGTPAVGVRGIVEDLVHATTESFSDVSELLLAIERAIAPDQSPLEDADQRAGVMEP